MNYANHAAAMREAGYREKPPSYKTGMMDADVVAEIPCPKCGATPSYRPWSRTNPQSYRPVSFCACCGYWEEF